MKRIIQLAAGILALAITPLAAQLVVPEIAYEACPISPTYLPVLSNLNIREPPCANGRAVPSDKVGCPVRV